MTVTQPLRDEHKELLPHIETLRMVADSVGQISIEPLRQGVEDVLEFLMHHLIPHAEAEDRALYPVVGTVMGAPDATATMSRDHVEVGRLTDELASLRSALSGATLGEAQAKALRRVLYGLYALVKLHFAKEEEVYLPLLDARLSAEAARDMFEAMEQAARQAKGRDGHAGGRDRA
jgi:hemerythrin-like domain-containing protein